MRWKQLLPQLLLNLLLKSLENASHTNAVVAVAGWLNTNGTEAECRKSQTPSSLAMSKTPRCP